MHARRHVRFALKSRCSLHTMVLPFALLGVAAACHDPTAAEKQRELGPLPNVGRIAFAALQGSQRDIFVMRPDGSDVKNITNDADDEDRDPTWSPDGRRIAFTHLANHGTGGYEIYVMNADGTGRVDVTNDATWEFNPSWSPDGTHLAYNTLENSEATIETIAVDGTGRVAIGRGVDPSWSPDGRSLAFLGSAPGGPSGIVVANTDGTNPRVLAGTTPSDLDPIWSPDGTELAYISGFRLAIINADGTNRRVLDDVGQATHRFPAWSPDGKYILYTRDLPVEGPQVYVVGRDLGAFRPLTVGSAGPPVSNESFQATWGIDPQ